MDKIKSARFVISVALTFTACIGFIMKMIPAETFVPIVILAIGFYFNRTDRKKEE